jgi:arsenite-transporting ATPase
MEIDPSQNVENNPMMQKLGLEGGKGIMSEIMSSIPGIDEATSFGAVLNSIDEYNFDLIIFDTAPTGHTLRLLNFPNIIEKALLKLIEMKEKFGGMMSQFSSMMGGQDGDESQEDA